MGALLKEVADLKLAFARETADLKLVKTQLAAAAGEVQRELDKQAQAMVIARRSTKEIRAERAKATALYLGVSQKAWDMRAVSAAGLSRVGTGRSRDELFRL
jgi:hypothetical protein